VIAGGSWSAAAASLGEAVARDSKLTIVSPEDLQPGIFVRPERASAERRNPYASWPFIGRLLAGGERQ
jgi:hypothetical protein